MSTAQRVSRVIAMFIAILSCLLVGEAKADSTSGNELWDACQANLATEPIKKTFCIAYIVGASETLRALIGGYYCLPDNVPNGQLIEIVELYLRAHPQKRQDSAQTLIHDAFKKKFRCD
jgi:ABC-type sulfate transport system permease component